VESAESSVPSGGLNVNTQVTVKCPTGSTVVAGGGYELPGLNSKLQILITENRPEPKTGVPTAWKVAAIQVTSETVSWRLVGYVDCAP
jgi:hypothetical protein